MNIITTIEMVMPDKAKEYLATMGNNRPLSSRDVDKWCRIIRNGDFKTTHQGIAFNARGELIDGQHRLTACALTNIPITVCVTRGLEDDTMTAIDTGKGRSFFDVMHLIDTADEPAFRSTRIIGSVRTMMLLGYGHMIKPTPNDVARFMEAYPEECKALYRAAYTRAKNRPTVIIGGAALAALLCGERENTINSFFDAFCQFDAGDGCYNYQAAFSLSKIIQDAKSKRIILQKNKVYNLTQGAIWHFAHNTNIKMLREWSKLIYDVSDDLGVILKGE